MSARLILTMLLIATQAHAGWLLLGRPALPKLPTFWIRILYGRRALVSPQQFQLLKRPSQSRPFQSLEVNPKVMSVVCSGCVGRGRDDLARLPGFLREFGAEASVRRTQDGCPPALAPSSSNRIVMNRRLPGGIHHASANHPDWILVRNAAPRSMGISGLEDWSKTKVHPRRAQNSRSDGRNNMYAYTIISVAASGSAVTMPEEEPLPSSRNRSVSVSRTRIEPDSSRKDPAPPDLMPAGLGRGLLPHLVDVAVEHRSECLSASPAEQQFGQ